MCKYTLAPALLAWTEIIYNSLKETLYKELHVISFEYLNAYGFYAAKRRKINILYNGMINQNS